MKKQAVTIIFYILLALVFVFDVAFAAYTLRVLYEVNKGLYYLPDVLRSLSIAAIVINSVLFAYTFIFLKLRKE